ncbi:TPA: sialate O-acetylesterase [Escherichia coli]|nr:sialate O-acetylesterase [Escherichia coli]
MSEIHWKKIATLPGDFSVKVSGGTVAFLEGYEQPPGGAGGITFADCVVRFSTVMPLWARPVSGDPAVEITTTRVVEIIPVTEAIAGTIAPSDWGGTSTSGAVSSSEPDYYYVVVLAGQSNGMAYGEGLPLPETYDRPEARIKQLARRSTVTPGGEACSYNDIIPADHCLHDVQDMSGFNHPKADLTKGQYGCVGQGLHIAKKLLPFMPSDAGILLVPCCRGSSGFTTGTEGSFSESSGATAASAKWGTGKPLYQDLISRTKAALAKNPKNRLLAVVWMQGENDLASGSQQHNGLFTAMVNQYRTDLADYAAQCVSGSADTVPWICGDTTYYWKDTYATQYEAVYGGYKNQEGQNIYFVPFMTDENGANTPTNLPAEDPDIVSVGYYGAASRTKDNWTSSTRNSHFSSWARRGIIADRLASAILTYAGRTTDFISGEMPDTTTSTDNGGSDNGSSTDTGTGDTSAETGDTSVNTGTDDGADNDSRGDDAAGGVSGDATSGGSTEETGSGDIILTADDGTPENQGWTVDGTTVTTTANTRVSDSETLAQNVYSIPKQDSAAWSITHPADAALAGDILTNGGQFFCRFRITDDTSVASQYALGFYWLPSSGTDGITFNRTGSGLIPSLLNLYVQTDSSGNMNLCMHCGTKSASNLKITAIGAFDNNWHTISLAYHGGGTARATLSVDGTSLGDLTLTCAPATAADSDILRMTSITTSATYNIEVESLSVTVNGAAEAA